MKSHRRVAVECFNKTWKFLEMKKRDDKNNMEMLLLAHTSLYHWKVVGTPRNWMIGEWQVSRAYAAVDEGHLSVVYAKTALERCIRNKISDLLPSAYEGIARAYAAMKSAHLATAYLRKATAALEDIKDPEDKRLFASQIRQTQSIIRRRT